MIRFAHVNDKKINFDTYEIIFYEQPNPKRLQFLALEPLELDISSIDMSITKKDKVLTQKQLEELSNLKNIIEYGHTLNNESSLLSDDLEAVLVQVNLQRHIMKANNYLQIMCRSIHRISWNLE